MRKLLFVMLVMLLLGTAVVEAQKKTTKSGIYSTPTKTDDEGKPTGTSGKAADKGSKADTYYVVQGSGLKYDGKDAPEGTILINPDLKLLGGGGSQYLSVIPATTATTIGKKDYSYDAETNSFEYTKTTIKKGGDVDNLFEKYKIVTETTTTIDEKGNVVTTQDQVTKICGAGLTSCTGTYTEIPGSHQSRTETWTVKEHTNDETGKVEKRPVLTETSTAIYDSSQKGGEPKAYFIVTYMPTEEGNELSSRTPKDVEIKGANGYTYYLTSTNEKGETTVVINEIGDIPGLSRADKDAIRERAVQSGALGFDDALKTLTWYQSTGKFIRAYYEYAGLRQLTSLFWPSYDKEVQERKARIQQQFCLAAGITNCVVSTICGSIYPINSDNVLAGRGPGGEYVTSAVINAEKSIPIEVEGMTRQQLIDIFGNFTVIKGVLINLTDPAFDPRVLGRLKLRLYHIQYGITNNAAGEEDLGYNIVFRNVDEQLNSSYGTPIGQARWWTDNPPKIAYRETARDDLYKFSATDYNSVCLTFDKDLPSGHAVYSSMVNKLCVPVAEYAGPPTEIGAAPGAAAPPTPGTTVAAQPGALV